MPDQPYTDQFDWVTISDFRPGIYSQLRKVQTGIGVPAPLGSAQAAGTFRCIALPSGGLAPLPMVKGQYTVPLPDTDGNAALGYFNVDGFRTFGPVGPNNSTGDVDDFFIGIEYLKTGGVNRVFTLYRVDPVTGTDPFPADTLLTVTSTQLPTAEQYMGMSFVTSRMNPTSPFLTPGAPVMVTAWAPPAFAADRHVVAFPSPAAPGVTAVVELCIPNRPTSTGETNVGDLIGHQGRIVMLEYLTNQFGGRAGDAIPTNEQISFSDPANSYNAFGGGSPYTIGTQQEVFVQESPNGYGAWGSISAGELFLVKNNGGGLIVSGDLDSPTVTRLQGVVSTGGMTSRAASTPVGLIYYSRFNGAWMWRGADTSDKVSQQLAEDFPFYTPGPDKMVDVSIDFQEYGEWVLVTNNWLYDTVNGGWWRIEDPSVIIFQWYARGFYAEIMYAVPIRVNNTSKALFINKMSKQNPALSYQWTGNPIPQFVNRLCETNEVVVVAEGHTGDTITVNVLDISGAQQSTTGPFVLPAQAATQPVRVRLPLVARGYNLSPQVVAVGASSGPAPVIHSLNLAVREIDEAVQV